MWITIMIAALLVYGTVLIVYVSNTNGNSKATLIRTPQAGDNYVSQLSRNNMFGELSFGSKQRSVKTFREHHGGKIGSDLDPVTSAPDEYIDVLAGEDSQEKNEEIINDEDNDLDERDFGFLTRGWEKQEGKICTGPAHGDMEVRSLHLSKLMCASNDACHCIECERTSSGRNPQRCTLRAASQTDSSGSSDCYTRTDSRDGHGTHPVVPHPSKHRLRTRDDVVQLPRMVADREWKKHDAASCHGFANGDALSRDLEASKLACKENKYCYGIECERTFELNPKDCTLRSQATLASYQGADCYVPQWKKHPGSSCAGLVNKDNTVRDLEASKTECFKQRLCTAIQCEAADDPVRCTLRAFASFDSSAVSDCYERVETPS